MHVFHQAKRTTLIEDPQPSQTFTTKQLRLQPVPGVLCHRSEVPRFRMLLVLQLGLAQ